MKIPFKEHEIHPVTRKENSISYHIRKYEKKYGKEVTTSLIPTGRVPGKLFGLIKVHKEDNPTRPVVSEINTPEYKLVKFLDSIIKPYVPTSYTVQLTDNFLAKLEDFDFNSNQVLVSYDVKSFFFYEYSTILHDYYYYRRLYVFSTSQ